MSNFEKIALGAVLVTLTLFWVIITPAGVTSRPSQAAVTTQQINAPTVTETQVGRKETNKQAQRKAQRRNASAKIERLKRRESDTPDEAGEELLQGLKIVKGEPVVSPPSNIKNLESFYGDRDIPTFN